MAMKWLSRSARALVRAPLSKSLARRRFSRDLFYLAAPLYTPAVLAEAGGLRFVVATGDRVVGRTVFLSGAWDEDVIGGVFAKLAALGYQDFARKTFVDL